MLCEFHKTDKEWICVNCGRRSEVLETDKFQPSAHCRIPDNHQSNSRYLYNMKLSGVGDNIAKIIKKLGYDYEPMSDTRARLTFLNKRSVAWCHDNKHVIYGWFKQECNNRDIPFVPKIIKAIIRLSMIKTYNQSV